MTNRKLIKTIQEKTKFHFIDIESFFDALKAIIYDELKQGNKIQIRNIVTIDTRIRKARRVRNPITKRFMNIPDIKVVKFRASSKLKKHIRS